MSPKKLLVIIEAPGKIAKLSQILSDLDIDAEILATGGHLFGNPPGLSPLGINAQYQETLRQPLKKALGTITKIKKKSAELKYVLIATDPDQEGEVIADDIQQLLDSEAKSLRLHLHGLDADQVENAFELAIPHQNYKSWPGTTRRILDRLIGAAFSQNNISVGRVQSAILGALKEKPVAFAELTLTLPSDDGGEPFVAKIPVTSKHQKEAENALMMSEKFHAAKVKSTSLGYMNQPWNLAESLINIANVRKEDPIVIYKEMQTLYEEGELSYIRTDSHHVTRSARERIQNIASQYGVKVAYKDDPEVHLTGEFGVFYAGQLPLINHEFPHESPRPLTNKVDLSMPIKLLSLKEGILSLITRNLILSGMPVYQEKPEVSQLPDWAKSLDWKRVVRPMLPWIEPKDESGIKIKNPYSVIIQLMMDYGIGRPSTYVSHAEALLGKGLVDNTFNLTKKGLDWIQGTPPILLNPKISRSIEDAIKNNKEVSPEVMIDLLLKDIGPQIQLPIANKISMEIQKQSKAI